jgi:hypothetical protein
VEDEVLLVKHLLGAVGLSQARLAMTAGVNASVVNRLVRGLPEYPKARRSVAEVVRREVPAEIALSIGWDGSEDALYREAGEVL